MESNVDVADDGEAGLTSTSTAASSNTDTVTLARGASVTLVGRMAARGLNVLGQIALARLLGPEAFGLYAIGWTLLQLSGFGTQLGLDQAVVYYGSRYWQTDTSRLKGVLLQSFSIAIILGTLLGVGLYLTSPWLAGQVFHKPSLAPVLRWFSPAFVLLPGLKVTSAATRVSKRMRYSVYAEELTPPATSLFLFLLFYLLGWELFGAVAALVGSLVLAICLAFYYVRFLFPEVFSWQVQPGLFVRSLLAFSVSVGLSGIFRLAVSRLDRLVVGALRPEAEVGIYYAAAQTSILFGMIWSSLSIITAPMFADLYSKQEMGGLDETFKVSTKWGLYLSLPLFLIICFAPLEFMTVIFSAEYAGGALVLVILSAGQLIKVASGPVDLLLIMAGHQKRWLLISVVTALADIILLWLLVPRLGLVGVALATMSTLGGGFVLGLLLVRLILALWPYDRRYLKGLLATATTTAALFLLRTVDVDGPMLELSLTAAVSVGVFGIVLIGLGLDSEDRELVGLFRSRFGFGSKPQ